MPSGIDAFRFAAPLFRFALIGHLGIRFGEDTFDALADPIEYAMFFRRYERFHDPQGTLERAVLLADALSVDHTKDE